MSEANFSHVYSLVCKGCGPWELTFQEYKEETKDPAAAKVAALIAKEGNPEGPQQLVDQGWSSGN